MSGIRSQEKTLYFCTYACFQTKYHSVGKVLEFKRKVVESGIMDTIDTSRTGTGYLSGEADVTPGFSVRFVVRFLVFYVVLYPNHH
jgi:hypothetical protein